MNTEISRYLTDESGNSFSSDTDLQSLSNNSKVKNTNSGVSYKKVSSTGSWTPVFDKVPFQEGQPDAVLYSPQSLTSAQKQQARQNIEALGTSEVYSLLETLTNYSNSSDYAKIIDFGSVQVVFGYSYSPSQGEPKRAARSMIAEFGGYFDEMPVMLSTHILGWTHEGEQNAQGVLRNSMSPGYGVMCWYDGNQLECASYVALGKPFRQNHTPLSHHFTQPGEVYTASLQDVKTNSSIILEMYARSGDQIPTIEVDKTESSGIRDLTASGGTLHKYGWRNNKIKVSGDVYDYSVVRTEDGQFKITGSQQNEDSLSKYRKIVYRLEAISGDVSLKFTKTGDQDGYIVLRYSVNDPSNDSGDSDIPEDPETWGLTQFSTFTRETYTRTPKTEAKKTVGQSVSEGTVVREFHISSSSQTGPSSYVVHTSCYYVWKANGYTLTEEDKAQINNLPHRYYTYTSQLTYDSGTV